MIGVPVYMSAQNCDMTLKCRIVISALLIVSYLCGPLYAFSAIYGDIPQGSALKVSHGSDTSPSSDRNPPCHEEGSGGCCGADICQCSCHAPNTCKIKCPYSPAVVALRFHEPRRSLPKVYLSIFVPPQNSYLQHSR